MTISDLGARNLATKVVARAVKDYKVEMRHYMFEMKQSGKSAQNRALASLDQADGIMRFLKGDWCRLLCMETVHPDAIIRRLEAEFDLGKRQHERILLIEDLKTGNITELRTEYDYQLGEIIHPKDLPLSDWKVIRVLED